FTIGERERHGLIGPNGAGKSTLLKCLAGLEPADAGEVALRKGVRMTYVTQDPVFDEGITAGAVLRAAARDQDMAPVLAGQAGFNDLSVSVDTLSGGWRKRLALVQGLVTQPDLLLLDEPTNHLDLEGIEWLEGLLVSAPFASCVITHDRAFLEDTSTHVMELNRAYAGGLFRVEGPYSTFLEKREQFFAAQARQRESLESKVRREIEWLRRGAKARTRKAKARIDAAMDMIAALEDLESRTQTSKTQIDFTASDRKTKKLIEAEGLSYEVDDRALFRDLRFHLSPGFRMGLAGRNGSGKTTLLRLLLGQLSPKAGAIRRADFLKMVYFEQQRQQIDPALPLKRALAPEGDSVLYRGRPVHVNGWAKRFLFREEQLAQPVGALSGGERARVHIARLMLEEADVLLLDEPANDLDIPTLEVLEESLLDFPGALILVTHDRYLMDRVATHVLGLDGEGGARLYADLPQWEDDLDRMRREKAAASRQVTAAAPAKAAAPRKKLSYLEQREWDAMERRILEAEAAAAAAQTTLAEASAAGDGTRIAAGLASLRTAEAEVERLYARWAELEAKLASG
ncbi:MAG: ABC-F family ATP-binding cassette domain-containing protein, partial [Anaerolineae bacterium]|nr:ABC-F family ATP-binding cassette domain-containing protein [Anaerolineae bacterium]